LVALAWPAAPLGGGLICRRFHHFFIKYSHRFHHRFICLSHHRPMSSASISVSLARERVLSVVAAAVGLAWLGDFLFWNHPPGVSVAIFGACAAAILSIRSMADRPSRSSWIAAMLLALSTGATFLELSFSNVVVLLALLAVLMGERHYPELAAGWARWSESFVAWFGAPGRWPWLARTFAESELANVGLNSVTGDRAARSAQILAPAVALAVVFGVVLSFGNAIFRQLLTHFESIVADWISSFDFSVLRILLWIAFATFGLALVRPRAASGQPRLWTRPIPRFFRADLTVAVLQSCAVFVALNAMFFAVNTIDVIYLWGRKTGAALPEEVTFSEFVHQGVYSLIFAVLLSAVVIAVIFQQEARVTSHRAVKSLAWLWIVQNLILIAGVLLRLKLYVDAYQLSELRVYVGCFLLLVTVGFGLLALHIAQSGSLGTLIWRNTLAAFALFFLVQFPDVAGRVARFNVRQWNAEPARTLDLAYLETLGPGAWPVLCEVASMGRTREATAQAAGEVVQRLAVQEIENNGQRDWRSYQARRSAQGKLLIAKSTKLHTGE
jgi:hypothetical protein